MVKDYCSPTFLGPNRTLSTKPRVVSSDIDPLSISGLFGWVKDTGHVKFGGVPASLDGDLLASWENQSGTVFNFTYGVNQPVLRTNFQNGRSMVQFGTNAYFQKNYGSTFNQPICFFIALKTDTLIEGKYFFLSDTSNGAANYTNHNLLLLCDSLIFSDTNPIADNTTYIISGKLNGASSFGRVNGVQVCSGDVGSSAFGSWLNFPHIGSSQIIYYGEALFYNANLTANNFTDLETYLNHRWNMF